MNKHKYKFNYTNNQNYPFLFCGIILIGMGLFFVYSFVAKRYFFAEYPNGDFLFYRNDIFMDFFNVNYMSEGLNPYIGGKSSYPPFILLISYLLTLFVPDGLPSLTMSMTMEGRLLYLFFFITITLAFMVVVWSFLRKRMIETNPIIRGMIVICCVFNAPFIWNLDRGNYLLLAVLAYFLFYYFYNKNDNLAVLFLSIAIAIKIYPIFSIVLFLFDKKYKKFFQCILITGFLSLFPLLFFKGGIIANIISFCQAVLGFGAGYELEYMNIYFSVGINSFLKLIQKLMFGEQEVGNLFSILYAVLVVLILITGIWLLVKEKRMYVRSLILTVFIVFIPPISYEYNLMYLLVPGILLLVEENKNKSTFIYCILICLLLIPKSYIYLFGMPDCISISVILNPLILIGILLYFVYEKKGEIKERFKIRRIK